MTATAPIIAPIIDIITARPLADLIAPLMGDIGTPADVGHTVDPTIGELFHRGHTEIATAARDAIVITRELDHLGDVWPRLTGWDQTQFIEALRELDLGLDRDAAAHLCTTCRRENGMPTTDEPVGVSYDIRVDERYSRRAYQGSPDGAWLADLAEHAWIVHYRPGGYTGYAAEQHAAEQARINASTWRD